MKFKRIDVDTVRCLISEEELLEHGLEVEDFLQNDGKAEEFLREILSQAAEEVGYRIKGGNISIQVSVLPDHVLALTFSESQDAGIASMLEHLKSAVEHLSQNVRAEARKAGMDEQALNPETGRKGASDLLPLGNQEGVPANKLDYQLAFESLDVFGKYCEAVWLEVPVENSLYKLEQEDTYYLLMKKGIMTDKQLCRLLGASLEFASGIYAAGALEAFVREHGIALLEENAIQKMQAL